MQQRYEALQIRAALSRRVDFEQACNELTVILHRGHGCAPKKLQFVLFEDARFAIQCLCGVETSQHLSALTKVVQAAENVLPRQRKTQVLGDFKHAMVMHRRRNKCIESEVCCDFSKDILIDIFGHLDARSLARAASVCRLWKTAADDELIWKNLFDNSFRDSFYDKLSGSDQGPQLSVSAGKAICNQSMCWKNLFKNTVTKHPSWFYASNRAFCMICERPIWLESRGKGTRVCSISDSGHYKLKPLLPIQVSQFLLKEDVTSGSSSSSDSDSDINSFDDVRTNISKLWSIPKLDYQSTK